MFIRVIQTAILRYLIQKDMLPQVIAYIYINRFQNRGLPTHAYILHLLTSSHLLRDPDHNDADLAAEPSEGSVAVAMASSGTAAVLQDAGTAVHLNPIVSDDQVLPSAQLLRYFNRYILRGRNSVHRDGQGGSVALAAASTGIAALLLDGGTTAHSRMNPSNVQVER
jgi:hypothetical protein